MRRLRPLFRRSEVEREMDAELHFHRQLLVEEFVRQGMTQEEAQRRAQLEFGSFDQVKENAREARLADRMFCLWRDLTQAVRSLVRTPGFTAIAVLTLALGIGANTAMFSLLDHMILRNLPVKNPERLVAFRSLGVNPGMDRNSGQKMSFSYPKYLDFRDRCSVFEGVLALFSTEASLSYNGSTEIVSVELVSGNYFDVLGVRPELGRLLTPADDRVPMGHPVATLSYFYWQRRFGGDPSIVGRQITVNGMPLTVVGVSARQFQGVQRGWNDELRVPMMMKDLFTENWRGGLKESDRFWAWLNILARVKDGIPLDKAEAGANVFYRQILEKESGVLWGPYLSQRDEFVKKRLELLPAGRGLMWNMAQTKTFLLELAAMTGIVLLIACVNLAGLLLARTVGRRRELVIRLALGASRMGALRQLIEENLILAAAGGIVGMLLAAMLSGPAIRFLFSPEATDVVPSGPDLRVLSFALGATIITALALALTPMLQIREMQVADVLKSETGASAGSAQARFRKALVILQLSFCIWLMIAGGLFARSLERLKSVDLGFQKENLIIFLLNPSLAGYKAADSVSVKQRVEEALAAIPGVTAAASSAYGVMMGRGIEVDRLEIDGYKPQRPEETEVRNLAVTPGFLKALGMQLLAGRDFAAADMGPERTVIVNQTFANKYFDGKNPVGRRIRLLTSLSEPDLSRIVGMVRDQKYSDPREVPQPFFYVPARFLGEDTFYIRTAQQPEKMIPTVRKIVERQAPGVPIVQLRTMEDQVGRHMNSEKQMAALAIMFGLLATILAAIGLYGVMSYTVALRTREIGIRMALGAVSSKVLAMVIWEVGQVIGMGLLIGLPSGLALARLIRSELYGISPLDPFSAALAAIIVGGIAVLAGLMPARRATRVDPMLALRWE